jgi:hypothetical protein
MAHDPKTRKAVRRNAGVKFTKDKKDLGLILKVVERAMAMDLFSGTSRLGLEMDISACHANGNPLDLQRLLDADGLNFVHDVAGIGSHLDRRTGKLEGCFRPRFSVPRKAGTAGVAV